jgi:hypothetical protein
MNDSRTDEHGAGVVHESRWLKLPGQELFNTAPHHL